MEKQFACFDNKADFNSYAEGHYLPLLARLQYNNSLTIRDKKLIGFLLDDIKEILKQK